MVKKCVCKLIYGLMSLSFSICSFQGTCIQYEFPFTQVFLQPRKPSASSVTESFTCIRPLSPRSINASVLTDRLRVQENFVEITRFELVTSCLQGRRSPN